MMEYESYLSGVMVSDSTFSYLTWTNYMLLTIKVELRVKILTKLCLLWAPNCT